MTTESFHFLNGPLKGERELCPTDYFEMVFDGEHLVLTEELGGAIPEDLPAETQRQVTWAVSDGEQVLLVKVQGQSLLYLRSPLVVKAYSFLTAIQ